MARRVNDPRNQQIVLRCSNEERLELDALAALNGIGLSDLVRQCTEIAKAHFKKEGELAARRRANTPHGVTPSMEETALEQLIREIGRNESITLPLKDVLSPKAKAVYRLLQIVWADEPTHTTDAVVRRLVGAGDGKATKKH